MFVYFPEVLLDATQLTAFRRFEVRVAFGRHFGKVFGGILEGPYGVNIRTHYKTQTFNIGLKPFESMHKNTFFKKASAHIAVLVTCFLFFECVC